MTTQQAGTFVTATFHLPPELSAPDLIDALKFLQGFEIEVVQFSWPTARIVPMAA